MKDTATNRRENHIIKDLGTYIVWAMAHWKQPAFTKGV